MIESQTELRAALPFLMPLAMLPLVALGAIFGGLTLWLAPLYAMVLTPALDRMFGQNEDNADINTPDSSLFWHRRITLVWLPLQIPMLIGTIWVTTHSPDMAWHERLALMAITGLTTGTIGITFAHELIHQKNRWERRLGEGLLVCVLYTHFKSEHVFVHHRYVGTPRDPVTARYNESYYHFLGRVLPGCLVSAWQAETARLGRRKLPWYHQANPFWRYGGLSLLAIFAAFLIGGPWGIAAFVFQAFVAICVLEQVNYVEHYGLTRKHLGEGKYEHVRPHHSWDSTNRFTNYLLINLQRHADHHARPDRRYPLLQAYEPGQSPRLPYGYPAMTALSLNPWLWRRVMNRKVRKWRADHYPEITRWDEYNKGLTPMPR